MYLRGNKTAKDIHESIRWLQTAALDNNLKAQKTLADIYLLDISMPILNGLETAHRLCKKESFTPGLYCAGGQNSVKL